MRIVLDDVRFLGDVELLVLGFFGCLVAILAVRRRSLGQLKSKSYIRFSFLLWPFDPRYLRLSLTAHGEIAFLERGMVNCSLFGVSCTL